MVAPLWVSCKKAVKWHAHIFKWHSAGWRPHAVMADCDWSAIGPRTKKCFFSRTET